MAAKSLGVLLALLSAILAVVYQLHLKHFLELAGVWPSRQVTATGNTKCQIVRGLEACEKIVLHQPTGILYLACSFTAKRRQWTPALNRFDHAGTGSDYLAKYDPRTGQIIRMKLGNYPDPVRLSLHGFDVVPDASDSRELWFYVINHRKPVKGQAKDVGADSVIEVFKGTVSHSRINWIKTFNSKHLHTPNEVVGDPDGKAFYWTNDHGAAAGFMRKLENLLSLAHTSVGYCHIDKGCRLAATGLVGSNGLATSGNGTYYVGSLHGSIRSFERQKDGTLTLADYIKLGRPIDNLSIGGDGALYAAGIPKLLETFKFFNDPDARSPSSAFRITKNTGRDSFFGEKYKIDKIFEDNGDLMSSATTVAVDSERKKMFIHGLMSPHLLVCEL